MSKKKERLKSFNKFSRALSYFSKRENRIANLTKKNKPIEYNPFLPDASLRSVTLNIDSETYRIDKKWLLQNEYTLTDSGSVEGFNYETYTKINEQ